MLFPLFSLDAQHKNPSFHASLSQISTKFADTVPLCLCHCSHLHLDIVYLKFCIISFQESCIFFCIKEFSLHLLYHGICFSLHEEFILQSQPYWLVHCRYQHKFSSVRECVYQHVRSRDNHLPSVLRVGEQSES